MRSRERGFAWAAVVLVTTGLLFAALAAWTLVARSTIPVGLDGTVTTIELRHEKHRGLDDVWMVWVDEDGPRHVDVEVADLLDEGDQVRKDAWDRTLTVNGEAQRLALSDDARAMLVVAPWVALVIAVLAVATSLRGRR